MTAYSRLNLCSHSSTAAKKIEDTHGQCNAECWRQFFLPNPTKQGSICNGDRGASLMARERGRCHASYFQHFLFVCVKCPFAYDYEYYRYIAAGVFSKCVLDSKGCCLDPVVYTRVANLQHWIRGKAQGVRDSAGCPKKIEVGISRISLVEYFRDQSLLLL